MYDRDLLKLLEQSWQRKFKQIFQRSESLRFFGNLLHEYMRNGSDPVTSNLCQTIQKIKKIKKNSTLMPAERSWSAVLSSRSISFWSCIEGTKQPMEAQSTEEQNWARASTSACCVVGLRPVLGTESRFRLQWRSAPVKTFKGMEQYYWLWVWDDPEHPGDSGEVSISEWSG